MTADELAKIEGSITASTNVQGLVNVNTAAEAVLACIPGVGFEKAPALVAYRQTNPNNLSSIAWVTQVLDRNSALLAGPYITTRSYQFAADVAALGHYGRGYRRVRVVFDTTEGTPRIVFRQDLTHLGWALGRQGRNAPLLARQSR